MKLRKTITIILCICLLGSLACGFADNATAPQGNQPPQMGGNMGGQPPQMGGNGGQPPEMGPGGETPGNILGSWNKLLEDGIIDAETLKAVEEYLMSKMTEDSEMPEMPADGEMPQMPGNAQNMEPPEGFEIEGQPPEGFDENTQPPEMPEGEDLEGYPGITSELLNELYENGLLDDDTYLLLVGLIDANEEQ